MEGTDSVTRLYSHISSRMCESLETIRALSNERLKDLEDAKIALRASFTQTFGETLQLGKMSRPEHLRQIYCQSKSDYVRFRIKSFANKEEYEKLDRKYRTSRTEAFKNAFPSRVSVKGSRSDETMLNSKSRVTPSPKAADCAAVPDTSDSQSNQPAQNDCMPQQNEVTEGSDSTPNQEHAIEPGQNLNDLKLQWGLRPDIDRNSPEKRSTAELLKYWMKFNDENTMSDYLKDLRKRSPNAYALDLLKHRLVGDNEAETQTTTQPSNNKNMSTDNKKIEEDDSESKDIGPMGKIQPTNEKRQTANPNHPQKPIFMKMEANINNMRSLTKRSAARIQHNKENILGTVQFIIDISRVNERIEIRIDSLHLTQGFHPKAKSVYITTSVNTGAKEVERFKSRRKLVSDDSQRIRIAEVYSTKDATMNDVCDGSVTFRVIAVKKGLHIKGKCIAESVSNLRELSRSKTNAHTAHLMRH